MKRDVEMPVELTRVRSLIMDMDGVLYHGDEPISGGREFLDFLREFGIRFILLTNNSTLTGSQYVAKLSRMGVNVKEEDTLTSAEATAIYLARVAPPGTPVHLVGEDGIRTELLKHGFVVTNAANVPYVVVGFDRQLTYTKLAAAASAIRGGAQFIGTNPDRTYPTETGLVPGAGAILAALEVATGISPLVIGKPQPAIFELALQKLEAQPKTTAVVGDGLYTDIQGGQRLGLLTVLLLSGVTNAQQLASPSPAPDLVYDDIAALHRAWFAAVMAQVRT